MEVGSRQHNVPTDLRIYEGTPEGRFERGRLRVPLLLATLLTAGMVPVATLFDISIARWFVDWSMPGDFAKTVELTECYSHGIGVIFILLLIARLSPRKRWCLPRLATLAFGAGAIAVLIKSFVLRARPSRLNLNMASSDAAWSWTFDWTLDHVAAFESGVRSFPSGHTAIATGFTIGLCLMFPRGRILFVLLLGLSMMQRLSSFAHFTSDLMGGLAIGLFWGYACLSPRLLGALFDKMEPQGRGFERREPSYAQQRAA
jgi:membrane-associated phospholipid phosphatase